MLVQQVLAIFPALRHCRWQDALVFLIFILSSLPFSHWQGQIFSMCCIFKVFAFYFIMYFACMYVYRVHAKTSKARRHQAPLSCYWPVIRCHLGAGPWTQVLLKTKWGCGFDTFFLFLFQECDYHCHWLGQLWQKSSCSGLSKMWEQRTIVSGVGLPVLVPS